MSGRRRPARVAPPPTRYWGFHRLVEKWATRIVSAAAVGPGQVVVDLGAGEGALTLPLLDLGARVIAVEAHAGRADRLRRRVAGLDASVLTMDIGDFRLPGRSFAVVANPPFALAVQTIRALHHSQYLVTADLVLPGHLVTRLATRRGSGRLRACRGMAIPPSAFRPAAPHACAVLQLRGGGPPRRAAPR